MEYVPPAAVVVLPLTTPPTIALTVAPEIPVPPVNRLIGKQVAPDRDERKEQRRDSAVAQNATASPSTCPFPQKIDPKVC